MILKNILEEEKDRFIGIFAAMYKLEILTDADMKYMTVDDGNSTMTPSFISEVKTVASTIEDGHENLIIENIHPIAVMSAYTVLKDLIGDEQVDKHIMVHPVSEHLVDLVITT